MKSMTGYGYGEQTADFGSLSVELRGYNSRFLELNINLPSSLMVFEQPIREYLADHCERGKVEVTVRLRELVSESEVVVDTPMALSYYKALQELSAALGLGETPRLATIVSMEGVLQVEKKRDPERYRPYLIQALEEAMRQFEAQRGREGEATAEDILRHVGTIEASLATVQSYAPQLEDHIKKNLRQRFQEVMGDLVDENRILAETAVLLMKYTISEEISRLMTHLKEFRRELKENPAPGKKLDFLCQEMNREVNTIGSKSPLIEVSQAVVAMKDALENIREQLRNVE